MAREVRLIGYWDEADTVERWPDVCGFVGEQTGEERAAVVAYLRSGTAWARAAGFSRCRLCGRGNGTGELTDGEHFAWPEGLAHYVEEHGVRLPAEVTAVAGKGPAAPIAIDEIPVIDTDWWESLRTEVAEHLPGCRNSPIRRAWNLPGRADIWIDGVPPGDRVTMTRLRRLLGGTWPMSEMPPQPFRAVADGSPAALHKDTELRKYLFYRTAGALLTIDVED